MNPPNRDVQAPRWPATGTCEGTMDPTARLKVHLPTIHRACAARVPSVYHILPIVHSESVGPAGMKGAWFGFGFG